MESKNTLSQTYIYNKSTVFKKGMKDGIPIGLGYFAVAFSLGIVARNAGLSAFQGFLASLFTNASAGEYAVFSLIAVDAAFVEVALITIVANARYLLMSCALTQRISPNTKFIHRLLIAADLTDELFGITIAQEGYINPYYTYGAIAIAAPGWSIGTALGIIMGNLLPLRIVSALSVALYGMFLAIIIPPSKKNKVILGAVIVSFLLSYLATKLPYIMTLSSGTITIILTILISAVVAILFPVKQEEDTNA